MIGFTSPSTRTAARLVTGAAIASAAYSALLRDWVLTWGATGEEAAQPLPGDGLIEGPTGQTTRAISIAAQPEEIFPWLLQMGSGRAGAYTYDWIENLFGLDMHSAGVIVPELQRIEVGDVLPMGENGPGMCVAVLDRPRAFVLQSEDDNWVWSFTLEPDGGHGARLISRNRFGLTGLSLAARLALIAMEPGSLVMERKMLLGIKERAERQR